jgi:hypothetical protein
MRLVYNLLIKYRIELYFLVLITFVFVNSILYFLQESQQISSVYYVVGSMLMTLLWISVGFSGIPSLDYKFKNDKERKEFFIKYNFNVQEIATKIKGFFFQLV